LMKDWLVRAKVTRECVDSSGATCVNGRGVVNSNP
jgi:hypothetical protein